MDILNLGAGNSPVKIGEGDRGVNHDVRLDPARPWVTVAWDLNDLPWPWEDNSFDVIVARTVLEHLRLNLIESMNECWRILRKGGKALLKLPDYRHEHSFIDPTHYWRFSIHTVEVFDPETRYGRAYAFYTPRKWKIVKGPRLNRCRSSIYVTLEVRK